MERKDAEREARSRGWLSCQPGMFQESVLQRARLVSFETGEYVYHADDSGGGIYGLVHGGLGLYLPSRDASMKLAHIARTGVWIGHGPFMTRRRRTMTFRATEPSITLYVALSDLEQITARFPESARSIGALSDYNMDIAIAIVSDALIRKTDRRIVATLLRVSGYEQGELPPRAASNFRVTQADLGEMANATRDLVNRTLRNLEKKGWVSLGYAHIRVIDPAALSAYLLE